MTPDFKLMTKSELRAYVIAHPSNQAAFHAFVDRCTVAAAPETFDLPRSSSEVATVEALIRQKLGQ